MTLIAITEATGGFSYPTIRKGTLTQALRFYPNQFHTSAMKKNARVQGLFVENVTMFIDC